LDLFGRGFTLLDLAAQRNTAAFDAAASEVGMPLNVVPLAEPKVKQAYERNLVLIRPDGHVAWRGDSIPANISEIIDRIRGAH
jgi:hypothetical protein